MFDGRLKAGTLYETLKLQHMKQALLMTVILLTGLFSQAQIPVLNSFKGARVTDQVQFDFQVANQINTQYFEILQVRSDGNIRVASHITASSNSDTPVNYHVTVALNTVQNAGIGASLFIMLLLAGFVFARSKTMRSLAGALVVCTVFLFSCSKNKTIPNPSQGTPSSSTQGTFKLKVVDVYGNIWQYDSQAITVVY